VGLAFTAVARDEKSRIQALEHTQPMLPLRLGYVEGVTHDYRRHGTTMLFAALDTANGKVLARCRLCHRHQEDLDFLREIEKNVPKKLEVHIIVDNHATHEHRRVNRWLAARPLFHVHFTPTYASWFNRVERGVSTVRIHGRQQHNRSGVAKVGLIDALIIRVAHQDGILFALLFVIKEKPGTLAQDWTADRRTELLKNIHWTWIAKLLVQKKQL
jgi:transposase